MNKFIILPDVTCDLSKETREKFNLTDYIPSHIILPDGSERKGTLEWDWTTSKDFYKAIKKRNNGYSRSPASIDEIKEKFKYYLNQGYDILFMSISSKLSGTYNFALKAREELLPLYPDRKILCFDSLRYSLCFGLLVTKACEFRDRGLSIDDTYTELLKLRSCVHQMGPMEDLFFLASKGRISNGKAFMGSLIGIRPLGDINNVGTTTVLGKVKSKKAAIEATIKYIEKTIVNPKDQYIFIAHTEREEEANLLKNAIEEHIKPKGIIINECYCMTGTNIGPGLYAAYYIGKELSENLVEEQKIMNTILGK